MKIFQLNHHNFALSWSNSIFILFFVGATSSVPKICNSSSWPHTFLIGAWDLAQSWLYGSCIPAWRTNASEQTEVGYKIQTEKGTLLINKLFDWLTFVRQPWNENELSGVIYHLWTKNLKQNIHYLIELFFKWTKIHDYIW